MTRPSCIAAVLATLVGVGFAQAATHAKKPRPAHKAPAVAAEPGEPAVLRKVIAAHWELSSALKTLPGVQLVQKEAFEFQDFVQYVFDDGALRLFVSPEPRGGDIFALMVDTRAAHYESFAQLVSTDRYTTYHRGPDVVVLPLRPVAEKVFDVLRTKQWTGVELQRQLGSPSFHWRVHGAGFLGLTYVPQGLSFIGDPITPVTYQIHAADIENQWQERHLLDGSLPPVRLLSDLRYPKLQVDAREAFARELLSQRERIDQALTQGKRSPDGRFVVGHANLAGGMAEAEELVIRDGNKPEQRYRVPHFINDKGYLWLNPRTIVFQVHPGDVEFYTLDAPTGAMKLVARVAAALRPVTDFGVSGPDRFWFATDDGYAHQVTIDSPKPSSKSSPKPRGKR